MAMSARCMSASGVLPCAGKCAMPMLPSMLRLTSRMSNGSRSASASRAAASSAAAEAGDVAGAHHALEAWADLAEEQVADVMAERVVELLEVVQVDQQQGGRAVLRLGRGDGRMKAAVELATVGKAGEVVRDRLSP